jgi:hypothetical protein
LVSKGDFPLDFKPKWKLVKSFTSIPTGALGANARFVKLAKFAAVGASNQNP